MLASQQMLDHYHALGNKLITFIWAEDDGYGVVGYSWTCPECEHRNRFQDVEEGDHYRCSGCTKRYVSAVTTPEY